MKQSNVYRFLVPGFICVAMASGAARKTSHKMGSRLDACPHGLSQYQSGDVLMAVKTLKQCLEENPKNHSAWVAIASAYSEIGHFPEAVNAYGQANSLIPGNSATLTGQIDALQSMGATQEQIPLWRQLFALNPTDPVLAKSFLAILDSMGPEKYPEEYRLVLQCLSEAPNPNLVYLERLASLYLVKGLPTKSAILYRRLIKANPQVAEYYAGLGKALSLDQVDSAQQAYRNAILYANDVNQSKAYQKLLDQLQPKKSEKTEKKVSAQEKANRNANEKRKSDSLAQLASENKAKLELEKKQTEKSKSDNVLRSNTLLETQRTPVERAMEFFRSGKPDSAGTLLTSILTDTPTNAGNGDVDKAELLIKEWVGRSPNDPEPIYWLGKIAAKRQQVGISQELFTKAWSLQPQNGRYAEALAQMHRDRDEFKQAVLVLQRAEPNLSETGRLLFGECLAMAGDKDRALSVYEKLYTQKPSGLLASRQINLMIRMGIFDRAISLAKSRAYPNSPEMQFSLAKLELGLSTSLSHHGDLDVAVSLLKTFIKSDKKNPYAHYQLGLTYYYQGFYKKSIDAFNDALEYRADFPEALFQKAMSLVKQESADKAGDIFRELSHYSDSGWKAKGLYGMAICFASEGKWEAVEHHLSRSISTLPSPDALAFLSRACLKRGAIPDAEMWAKKALELEPGHVAGTIALTEAMAFGKQFTEAQQIAVAVLRSKPFACEMRVQRVRLSYQSGNLGATKSVSDSAMVLCPDEPMGYYYAGFVSRDSHHPEDADRYFKSFRKKGGDKSLLPKD